MFYFTYQTNGILYFVFCDYEIFGLLNEKFFFISKTQDYLQYISSYFSGEIHLLLTV